MKRSFGPKTMTRTDDDIRLTKWLFEARPEVVERATVEAVQMMFGRLNPRIVEARLLARQDAIRRQRDAG